MKKTESIERAHEFENTLNFVKKVKGFFEVWHEKSLAPLYIEVTPKTEKAFKEENWKAFERLEAMFIHRCDCVLVMYLESKGKNTTTYLKSVGKEVAAEYEKMK